MSTRANKQRQRQTRRTFIKDTAAFGAGLVLASPLRALAGAVQAAGQDEMRLVASGKTSHCIFVDPSAPESVKSAAQDLAAYFRKVTGALPELVVADEPPHRPLISLGETLAAKAAGLDSTAIPNDGFRIVTRDQNLFILGPDTPTDSVNDVGGVNNGTANGVYTFIEDYLGVQWLMPGELGEEYSRTDSLSIPALDRAESSPFNYRVVAFRSSGLLEDEWDRHLKLGRVAEVLHNHSWIETIPPSLFDKHPDWFAQSGGRPVIPSGSYYKLETTNPELVRAFAEVILETFRGNPRQRWYSLSPSDGGGFSDSPASKALMEKDPYGDLSQTPLVLKFYDDVARIVRKEFPNHKLGGYLYGQYRYPPAAGVPRLEPNLALMLVGLTHHYQLYRPEMPAVNDKMMRVWGDSAKKDGFDLYFYDYPISLMAPNAMICPPSPTEINFIFSRLDSYGYKGGYIYGNPIWPVFGAGNYVLAKLFWNPKQDARALLKTYCSAAFGRDAGPHIERIYDLLDAAFRVFYNRHPRAGSTLTLDHLKEVYAPSYREMEHCYLKAQATEKGDKQQQRLDLFGHVLSLMQWHLREYQLLPADYRSPLSRSVEEIDDIIAAPRKDFQIVRTRPMQVEPGLRVEELPGLADAGAQEAPAVPVHRTVSMLLHAQLTGEVRITVKAFHGNCEFTPFILSDAAGNQLRAGALAEDRTIRFRSEAGRDYFLNIASRGASVKLAVDGASVAYRARSFQVAGRYMDGPLPVYFYVPVGTKGFGITLGTEKAAAEVFSPDGRQVGRLDGLSRLVLQENDSPTGFWKLVLQKFDGVINVTLDEQVPPWFFPDPRRLMNIVSRG